MSEFIEEINDLIKAVPLVLSRDRKKRLTGEYWALKVRCGRIEELFKAVADGLAEFPEGFNEELVKEQLGYMKKYLTVLETRAELEDIDLSDIDLPHTDYCLVLFGDDEFDGAYRIGTSHSFVSALMRDLADICVKYRKSDGEDLAEFCKGMGDAIMLLMLRKMAEEEAES